MFMYHGTTEQAAVKALKEGLLPRSTSKIKGHWDHTINSNPEHVYLTEAYASYFAMSATPVESTFDTKWAILKIDVDKLDLGKLYPDEDFLAQVAAQGSQPGMDHLEGLSLIEKTEWFKSNLEGFQHHWVDSIKGLGNCSYKGIIPAEAIVQISLYDPNSNQAMTQMAMDPSISLMNYQIMGAKYRALTKWFFKDLSPVEDYFGIGGMMFYSEEQVNEYQKYVENTSGVQLLIN